MNSAETDMIGEVLGGYRLDEEIGRGGMGSVFRGTHLRLGRKAAIKILSNELSTDSDYLSRFFHEAKVVNDIHHPNIVDIIEFVEQDEPRRVAYIMELVEGPCLRRALRDHQFSLVQTLNIIEQIAGAMAAAHKIDVIHRDLKPENILLVSDLVSDFSQQPAVKVLDFGIAKIRNAAVDHQTVVGAIMGTPSYMSPEQVAAYPVCAASDVFSLGQILYEMLTNEKLFRGDCMEIMRAKISGHIPEINLDRDVPERNNLLSILKACLAFRPEERPSMKQVQDFIAKIRGALTHLAQFDALPVPKRSVARGPPQQAEPTPALFATSPDFTSPQLKILSHQKSPLAIAAALVLIGFTFTIATVSYFQDHKEPEVTALLGAVANKPTKRSAFITSETVRAISEQARTIRLLSVPSGATVFDDEQDKRLGTTPLRIEVQSGDKRVLILKLRTHRDKRITVDNTRESFKVELTKRRVAPLPHRQAPSHKRRPNTTEKAEKPTKTTKPKALKKSEVPGW